MARTLRDTTLDNRTARLRLSISGKPYYRSLEKGLHLGYRRGKTAGRWVARYYVGEQNYRVETLGTADDFSDDADGVEAIDGAAIRLSQEMTPAEIKEAVAACVINLRDCEDNFTTLLLEIEHGGDTDEDRDEIITSGRMTLEQLRAYTCLLREVLDELDS